MADQWAISYVTTGTLQSQRYGLFTSPNGSKYRILTYMQTIDTSIAAGEIWGFTQPIEGSRIVDFQWGTANARQVVLRFGVRCGMAGTFGVALRNGAANRSYVTSYTISAGEAGTDVYRTVVIPGDVTGTWPTDNTRGAELFFAFMAGTTYTAPATGWNAGNYVAPVGGITNGAGQTVQFHLFDVSLHLDPQNTGIAPAWQMPDEAEELRACQRYWRYCPSGMPGIQTAGTTFMAFTSFADMRAQPALTINGAPLANGVVTNGGYLTLTGVAANGLTARDGYIQFSTSTGTVNWVGCTYSAATMNKIILSARM